MVNLAAIARPYALASFLMATEKNEVSLWGDFLKMMVDDISEIDKIIGESYPISDEQMVQIVIALIEKKGETLAKEQKNFLFILAENSRLSTLSEISNRFQALRLEADGIVPVRIETAMPVDTTDFDKLLTDKLGQRVQTTYKEVPDLLGGVRIYIRDDVIDASIRGRLDKLAVALR